VKQLANQKKPEQLDTATISEPEYFPLPTMKPLTLSLSPSDGERVSVRPGEGILQTGLEMVVSRCAQKKPEQLDTATI